VFAGADRTLVAAPLDPALAAPPDEPAPLPDRAGTPPSTGTQRRTVMKPETNGHARRHGATRWSSPRTCAPRWPTRRPKPPDWWRRQSKKEKKVLSAVLTGLKQLNLGAEGGAR
jgi:hypothetical protein